MIVILSKSNGEDERIIENVAAFVSREGQRFICRDHQEDEYVDDGMIVVVVPS